MREIEWESCLLPPVPAPELQRRFQREVGRPGTAIRYFADNPWAAEVLIRLSVEMENRVELDAELADLVTLVVSQEASCRYCFAAMRTLLRVLGMPEARIARLEQDLMTADLNERERGALEFARRLARSNPLIRASDLEALRRLGYSELEIDELVAATALNVFFNRLSTLCALPPFRMEELPDRWYMRMFRPLVAMKLRKLRRHTELEPLRPEEREGPFSPVVVALDGLPAARALHSVLEGMWASPTLPRRVKALVFAVVARALGCDRSEAEATRLLLEDGLAREEIDQALAHLASPALDPVERIAVPFARETVWYQPAQIQRHGRQVLETLSREQFIELVTVAALANVVCRLGFTWGARG